MKNIVSLILCSLVCLLYQSCNKEETEANDFSKVNAPTEGTLLDGGEISSISLFCIENNKSMNGEPWYEYYPKTKIVSDYGSFKLILMLNRNAAVPLSDDINERTAIAKLEEEYDREKSLFLVEYRRKYMQDHQVELPWPVLFTAYTNGELSITCDKRLFGQQPGTNLSSYFAVSSQSPCIPIGVETPEILYIYDFREPMTIEAPALFMKETWLQPEYGLTFAKQPDEKYEELTLHITLPVLKEHVRDVAVSKYKGTSGSQKFTEAVYRSECLIKFNWK